MTTIYTIGHSRHPVARFAALLREQEIGRLIDVRSPLGLEVGTAVRGEALSR